MADQTAEADQHAPVRAPRKPRRWTTALLVAALLAVTLRFAPALPHERRVDLRLVDSTTVTGVDVTWSRSASVRNGPQDEPLRAASFQYAPGTAPEKINYTVKLPDGSYEVELVVRRGASAQSKQRTVTLDDADQITLPLW